MKHKFFQKAISTLLVSTFALGLMPMTVFASESEIAAVSESEEITTYQSFESTLAPGITQTVNSGYAADGKLINYYIAIADINREDVGVQASYKDAQCETLGMSKMTDQAAAMNAKHTNADDADNYIPHYAVVAGVNGDGYNTGTAMPSGAHVMNGVSGFGIQKAGNSSWFAIFEDGTALCGANNADWDEAVNAHGPVQEAIGGFQLVRKNGVNISYTDSSYLNDGRYPRSFVGVTADNKVVFMAVDGNGAGGSVGSNYAESLELMDEAGCTYILCLDGGGSATYISRPAGSNTVGVTSTPSDGSERAVSNGLVMYTSTPPSDTFEKAEVTAENYYVTPGSEVKVSAVGISPAGTAAEIPDNAVWTATNGTVENGVFISDGTVGAAEIALNVDGEVVGSTTINVVIPDKVSFTRDTVTVPFGATMKLDVTAKYGIYDVVVRENDFTFTVADTSVGTVSGNEFTASDSGVSTTVTVSVNGATDVTDTIEIKLGKGSEVIFDFEEGNIGADLNNWRTSYMYPNNVTSCDLSVVTDETGMVHSGDQALAFHYAMDEALHGTEFWNGGTLIWQGESVEIKNASSLGFWIYIPEDAVQYSYWMGVSLHDENGNFAGKTASNVEIYNEEYINNRDHSGWFYYEMPINYDAVYIEDNADCVNKYYNGSQFKYKANCFLTMYAVNIDSWKYDETNYAGDFTFYIDDVTVNYSDAVDDREKPIFSDMTYAVEGMSDATTLNGQTVTEDTVSFAGFVAEDMTNANNASGLDASSAVAYIDGVEVDCAYSNGMISVSDKVLTNGVHTIRMGISDKMGNYTEIKRQITVKTAESDNSVRVKPQDSTLEYMLNDSVYWVDVEVDAIETVKSIEMRLDLDSMNNWELEQIKTLYGFDCEYGFATGNDKAENILTLKFTRNNDYLSETGTTVIASLPVRVWDYVASDDHKHPDAVAAWKCSYVCAPALSVDVDTEMGVVTYLDDNSHTFSSEDIHTLCVSYTYGIRMRDYDKDYYNSHSFHTHTAVAIDDLDATCTEAGYTGRTWCETCDSPVEWGTTIPATGHSFELVDGVLKCACGELYNGVYTDGKTYDDGIAVEGWIGDSYWADGEKLTGIQIIDGYYYDLGEDGVCPGQTKLTGIFYDETISAWRYALMGELTGGWQQIAGNWHYFWKYNMRAATGEVTLSANGVTYQFDEKGMTKGAWHTTEAGTRYYYSDEFYRARQEGYQAFFEIDGKTYNFDGSGYVTYGQYRALRPGAFIMEREVFEFNEDGSLKGKYTQPGPVDCADGSTYFVFEDGKAYMDAGLVEFDGNYYFVVYSGKLAKDQNRIITDANSNGLKPAGTYYFDAEGKMELPFTGVKKASDGTLYYYENGEICEGKPGLVKYKDAYYDVKWSGKVAVNENRNITAEKIGDLDVKPDIYYFDAEGKMQTPFTGVKRADDGVLYYYVDGKISNGVTGLIEYNGAYYDVKWSGKVAVNENRNITAEKIGDLDVKPDIYYFDAEGKMQAPFTGVKKADDGVLYYYVDGKISNGITGLIEYNGAYYDVKWSGKVAVNENRNITAEKAGDFDIELGIYFFDAEGKMVK